MVYYPHYFVPTSDVGDLSPAERRRLLELATNVRPRIYLEVGIGQMGTFLEMARHLRSLDLACHCHGIDCFGELPRDANGENSHMGDVVELKDALAFLEQAGVADFCTLHRGDSGAVIAALAPAFTKRPMMAFIDGNHTYEGCRADFLALEPHLVTGDVVVFHDTLKDQHPDYRRGPRGVVEDFVIGKEIYSVLKLPDSSAIWDDVVDKMTVVRVNPRPARPRPVEEAWR